MRWTRFVLAATIAAGLVGCRKDRRPEVEQAVRTYLDRMAEAYRVSDATLVDPLVGDEQGLKLTGLIGVKRDAGVVLDAKLLSLEFVRVERRGSRWIAETRERWYYRDRRIGTGEQVGEDSTDSYGIRYEFSREDGRWILQQLEFATAPVVGRKVVPVPSEPRVLHGLGPREKGAAGERGAPGGRADPGGKRPETGR